MNGMKREHIETMISQEVERIISGTALELVDVEYVREKNCDLEDCQAVSEKLSKVLDEKDPIQENYLLEVSSPGLDRILKKDKDFVRYAGRTVDIHFFQPYNGKKDLVANLVGKGEDGKLTVLVDGNEEILDMKTISQVRLHIDF